MFKLPMKRSSHFNSSPLAAVLIVSLLISPTVYAVEDEVSAAAVKIPVKSFQVLGKNPLSAEKTKAILDNYLGEHEGIEGLEAASNDLEDALKQAGFSFIRVILPPQSISSGVIKLKLVEFPIGKVEVTGNKHFSNENILRAVPDLATGKTPNLKKLNRSLDLANRSPVRKTKLSFAPDNREAKINATLRVIDKSPLEFFVLANNTGNDNTGDYRTGVGVKHHNLFGLDHGITFSYTTSPSEVSKIKQYGLNYRLPLYRLGDELNFFVSDSDSNIGTIADGFEVKGAGKVYGINYSHFFEKSKDYQHQLDVSVQDKLFVTDLSFQGTPIGNDVRSRPLEIKYTGRRLLEKGNMNFFLGYRINLPGGSKSNDSDYNAARQGADSNWSTAIVGGNVSYPLPQKWFLNASFNAQMSNEPLISGEQFGFGGSASLPGFEEREVIGDSGYSGKLELFMPRFKNGAQLFTSYEQGKVTRENLLASELAPSSVSSIGLGVSSPLGKKCLGRAQFGYVLDGIDGAAVGSDSTDDGDTKTHFNMLCVF